MIQYFLNDTLVREPAEMAGLYLQRELSPRFRGYLYDQLSRVEGIGNVRLDDPDGVDTLLAQYRQDCIESRATFRAETAGARLFEADVDFSTLRRYRNREIEFALHDRDADRFIQNIDQTYDLPLTDLLELPAPVTGSGYALTVDPDRLTVRMAGTSGFKHASPAFRIPSGDSPLSGTLLEIPDHQPHPFYKNSTGAPVVLSISTQIGGQIRALESVQYASKVIVRDASGSVVWSVILTYIELSAGQQRPFAVLEDVALRVPVDGTVSFVLEGQGATGDLRVEFDTNARLLLSEGDGRALVLPSLTVHHALEELVRLASGGELSLRCAFFRQRDLHLTPYGVVRGRDLPLSLSFGALFDDLSALYNLRAFKSGSRIVVEPFVAQFAALHPYRIRLVNDYAIEPDFSRLYRAVRLGFEHWKPANDAGQPEITAPLTLETGLPSAKSELDLRCKTLLASRRLLAEAYQKRTGPATQTTNEENDARVFLVDPGSETAFHPVYRLLEWKQLLGTTHRQLRQVSGEGAFAREPLPEQQLTGEPLLSPDQIQIQCTLTTDEFYAVGDFVEFTDLSTRYVVYVESILHRPYKAEGDANTTIEGVILNPNLFS